jgi:hypothetical protein
MKTQLVGIALLAAALSPQMASASVARESLNACARAFAASIAPSGTEVPKYHLDGTSFNETESMVSQFFGHEYQFDLQAANAKTGAVIARAKCQTDRRGVVTSLSSVPVGVHSGT